MMGHKSSNTLKESLYLAVRLGFLPVKISSFINSYIRLQVLGFCNVTNSLKVQKPTN